MNLNVSNMKKRRLVSAIYQEYFPFSEFPLFDRFHATTEAAELKEDDALVVWGGEDISPSLYKRAVSRRTEANDRPSRRDAIEWSLMQRAKELQIPIIGVCRGAQMLCALSGGFLIQDVTNHYGTHPAMTFDGYEIRVNSIHHQMMYPFDVKHEMLASVIEPQSPYHLDVDESISDKIEVEPEFVYFPEVKGFAIQWHPEAMNLKSNATEFIFQEMIKRM